MAVGYCSALGLVACVLELIFPRQFAGLFTSDPAVVAEAVRYLRIAAYSQLAVCAEIVLEAAMGGAGDTVPPMLSSTALTASRIPLAAWAAVRWGSVGILWVISLTAIGRAVAMMLLWGSKRWQRRTI
jgi:Na+-driven multidrug efflux pump